MCPNKNDRLKNMMVEADKKSFDGRLNRLSFLMGNLGQDYMPFPATVLEYFEETKLCFYEGAFIASILVASATYEELLRQIYRDANQMKKARTFGLARLTMHAVEDGLISLDEAEQIANLRRLRNKLTHVRIDFRSVDLKKKRTYLDFLLLFRSNIETFPIETLAKDVMKSFLQLVPKFCNRFWGLGEAHKN